MKKVVLFILSSMCVVGCAGDVRFARPGEFVAPQAPETKAPVLREEVFQWGRPSGEAWFFWVSPSRARATELYRGLGFSASVFSGLVESLFSGIEKSWIPCAWYRCQPRLDANPFDPNTVKSFLLAQAGASTAGSKTFLDFTWNVLDVIKTTPPAWKSQRWVHVFVPDIDDLFVGATRGVEPYWDPFQELNRELNKIDGFSSARLQFTFAYYPEVANRERCPRLSQWEGRRWKELRDGAGWMTTFADDVDVCGVVHGDVEPMKKLAEDAVRFQTRLILARPVFDPATVIVEVGGTQLIREDFSCDRRDQEVKIHESVAERIPVGTSIKIRYQERLL